MRRPVPRAKSPFASLVLGDPHAESLVALTAAARVDLLEVELALARLLAERLRDAGRRGDATLREYVRSRIDLVNAIAALQLAESVRDMPVLPLFIAGGDALDRDTFVAAATASTRADAAAMLARAFAGSALASLFASSIADPAELEAAALARSIAALRRRCRLDPLGSAPALLFLTRLEAQERDVRRLAWGLALKVPPEAMRAGLVTPWT